MKNPVKQWTNSANKRQSRDPGTGTQYHKNAKRVINKDGSFNSQRVGIGLSHRDIYQMMVKMTWPNFIGVILLFLLAVNILFAAIYFILGVSYINAEPSTSALQQFLDAFYFSFQTFTTVGYGALHPLGNGANIVALIETVVGWMCFAIITGILYGRFSKPSARLLYSRNALISPYRDGKNSLQFRISNMRQSMLMEMNATIIMAYVTEQNGELKRQFSPLKLERDFILFFPLSWTIVHPIDEESPLYQKSKDEMERMNVEIMILIKGFDDTFSQTVHSRYSYTKDEIKWGARFNPAFETTEDGDVILQYDWIHDYREADLG